MRFLFAMFVSFALAEVASAQVPTQPFPGPSGGYGPGFNPNNFMPNIFNPQTQPLSPYLNLLRGNPATDYYFGVRPGTVGLAPRGLSAMPTVAGGGNRTLFFPQFATGTDPIGEGSNYVLPPAGHPVVFGNTMGFFPSPGGQAGTGRAGLSGLGTRGTAKK